MTLRCNTPLFWIICLVIFFLAVSQARSQTCEGVAKIHYPEYNSLNLTGYFENNVSGSFPLGPEIEVEVMWRIFQLAGEPVKYCVARWKIEDGETRVYIKDPESSWSISVRPPVEILRQISVSQVLLFGIQKNYSRANYGKGCIFDPGVMAIQGNEWSFNVPGSPAWSSLFINANDPELTAYLFRNQDNSYLSAKEAKEALEKGFEELTFHIIRIKFDLSAVENWYAEKLKAEKTQKEEALSDDEFWNTPRDEQEAAKTDAESEGAFWDTPRIAETLAARDERVMQEKQQEHEVAFAAMWDKETAAAKERYKSLIGVTQIISPKAGETVTGSYQVIVEVDALHRDKVCVVIADWQEFEISLDESGRFSADRIVDKEGPTTVKLSAKGPEGWQHREVKFTRKVIQAEPFKVSPWLSVGK